MLLKSKGIARRIALGEVDPANSLAVVPSPNMETLENSGTASIDLRLGRWFRTMRQSRLSLIECLLDSSHRPVAESHITKEYFVRFGDTFVLHPSKFVLGVTLEWLRLPGSLAGYVTGKSSLGRRGLIIETAAGIHPGFSGCLALELTNVGEVPISLVPGMKICQVFFHEVEEPDQVAESQFFGRRKPTLGKIRADALLKQLKEQE